MAKAIVLNATTAPMTIASAFAAFVCGHAILSTSTTGAASATRACFERLPLNARRRPS